MSLTVAIDIRPLYIFKDRGLGAALMTALLGLKNHPQVNRYLLLVDEFNYKNCTDSLIKYNFPRLVEVLRDSRFTFKVIPEFSHLMGSYDFTFEQLRLRKNFDVPKEAIFLGFSFLSPVLTHTPVSLYIPDTFVKVLPQYHDKEDRRIHHWSEVCMREARQILTCSENSKRDIVNYYKIHPDKIYVIYDNIEDIFKPLPKEEARNQMSEIDLPIRYVLTVGVVEPRKNQVNSVRALKRYMDESGDDIALVIAGQIGYVNRRIYTEVTDEVFRLGLRDKVHFLGYVNNEMLVNLYNCAEAFLFPSLYEGFGRPPVEALCCGIPVITSNTSCLPEITDGAAMLVNPVEPDQIASAMKKVLSDQKLRARMIGRGFEVSQRYTLDARVENLLLALNRLNQDR